jgi:uncharacterized protein
VITVIIGAPCSGKSTYAREHAKSNDIIIDFDTMAQCLGSNVDHGHNDQIVQVTLAAWMGAIREVTKNPFTNDVWIVDGLPTMYRQRLYSDAKAVGVNMVVSREELHKRATDNNRPDYYHDMIDRYIG